LSHPHSRFLDVSKTKGWMAHYDKCYIKKTSIWISTDIKNQESHHILSMITSYVKITHDIDKSQGYSLKSKGTVTVQQTPT
jgi:hypothetical protein